MNKPTAVDIAAWAETRAVAASDRPKPLSAVEKSHIVVASRREGMTLPRLASEFARSEEEIAAVLRGWTDSRDAAKHLLTVEAANLANRMIAEADPAVALDVLERIDVVRPKKGGDGNGRVTVVLNGVALYGMPGSGSDVVDGDVVAPLALEGVADAER
jgi:hypothetical protein